MARKGDCGKGKAEASVGVAPSQGGVPPAASTTQAALPSTTLASKVVAPQASQSSRPSDRSDVLQSRTEDRPGARLESRPSCYRKDRPPSSLPAPRNNREDLRPCDVAPAGNESSVHKALISKFADRLTVKVAESSKHSNPVEAFGNCANKLIELSYLTTVDLGLFIYHHLTISLSSHMSHLLEECGC